MTVATTAGEPSPADHNPPPLPDLSHMRRDHGASAADAVARERERCARIYRSAGYHRSSPAAVNRFIAGGVDADTADRAMADEAATDPAMRPLRAHVGHSYDDPAVREEAQAEGLAMRYLPASYQPQNPMARQFAGLSVRQVMEDRDPSIRRRGPDWLSVRTGGMHTTSDLSNLVANVAHKVGLETYRAASSRVLLTASKGSSRDFKPTSHVRISEHPPFERTGEHAEFKYGAMSDNSEKSKLETFGNIIAVSRQLIINDDLGQLIQATNRIAVAGANFVADHVVRTITSNPALSDGVATFHSVHGNLAATGAAISNASVSAGRVMAFRQRGLNGEQIVGQPVRYLLVPASQQTAAEQLVAQIAASTAQNANVFAGQLEVVAEPRLDDASTTAWYLVVDPAVLPSLCYHFLEGMEGVQIATREGFTVDGMEFRARLDFTSFWVDYRGWVKNPGG